MKEKLNLILKWVKMLMIEMLWYQLGTMKVDKDLFKDGKYAEGEI